ncbi:MAG TPA: AMP-binding protein [Dongiaceae bacterium]|nr:AMP-binding protein [Dongiaceae bacterium]
MDPATLLETAARRHGARPAAFCDGAAATWVDLARLADRIGTRFERAGARPGERVAALLPNCHRYLATYFAALTRGLVLVPLNARLAPREIGSVLARSGAVAVAGVPAMLAAAGLPPGPEEDGVAIAPGPAPDPTRAGDGAALLYFTSGSTGNPKGVILTRNNLAAHAEMTLEELRFTAADVWLHAAPMFHLADAWAIFTATAAGAAHVFLPRWDAAAAVDRMRRHAVTLTNLVPTMIPAFLDAAAAGGRPPLRLLLSGGAPIARALVRRIETELGGVYAQTYGLTETSPFLTFSLLDARHADLPEAERARLRARTGRAATGVRLRVATPPGAAAFADVPADDRTVGEVLVQGATVTPGYWRDDEATREAFRGGWFHTGDLGVIDRHGFLDLCDRIKDAIVTGGETVYSIEVEQALLEHAAVREAAVYGAPDDAWGESVRAAVVLAPGARATAGELIALCRTRIAAFKCPRAIDLLDALPRTGSGKIDKRALREPHWAGRARRIN